MAASHRRAPEAPPIPRYALYDEPVSPAGPRFIHVETIARRSGPRDWTIRAHAHHDLHQLLLIETGGGRMRAEAEQWRFGAGSLLIAPAGLVHGFRFDPGTNGRILTFADALAQRALAAEPALGGLLGAARATPVSIDAIARPLAGLDDELAHGAALGGLASRALLTLVLVQAARAIGDAAPAARVAHGRAAALVARLRAQIETHLGEGWSVAQHAAALGVSVSRLRALCAAAAGQAPIRLIQDRTLMEARRLLTHGSAPVSAIAYALGFADAAYFSRWFARIEGVPPARYRERARHDAPD